MCGRFAISDSVNEDITAFVTQTGRKAEDWSWDWGARYNVKPTQQIPVLRDDADSRELRVDAAHWSLVPHWSPTLKLRFPTFNARTEGIVDKRTWAKPVKTSRAIIPAAGYYEWTGAKGSKQPWWIHAPGSSTIGFAGLYSWWQDRSVSDDDPARWLLTATICTAPAIEHLVGIHDRVPRQVVGRVSSISKLGMVGSAVPA